MKVTDKLRSQVAKAVQVSMQIEGYRATRSNKTIKGNYSGLPASSRIFRLNTRRESR